MIKVEVNSSITTFNMAAIGIASSIPIMPPIEAPKRTKIEPGILFSNIFSKYLQLEEYLSYSKRSYLNKFLGGIIHLVLILSYVLYE